MEQIGLIGFGCVGQGVFNILRKEYPRVLIKKIVVKDENKKRLDNLPFIYNADEVIDDPAINIIIEAIDDSKAAFLLAVRILRQGKTLITANKKMLAENLPELLQLKTTFGGQLLYEGAVCGSIPVIRTIHTYYAHEQVNSITGIVNGSTNYILTLMSSAGLSYPDALKDAQIKGFAESDPTLDVEGIDAANKLSILCNETFGKYLAPQFIKTQGITHINKEDLEKARRENKKIKLIANAEFLDGRLHTSVGPRFLTADHPLFHIDNEYNSIILNGEYAGIQQLTGKGAGSLPTGLAVVSDLMHMIAVKKNFKDYDNYKKELLFSEA